MKNIVNKIGVKTIPFKKYLVRGFMLLLAVAIFHHLFLEQITYDENFEKDQRLYQLLDLQRQIDRYAALSEIHIQGTHNSYNSDAYHHLLRYHDRQQTLTVFEQLENGARFIELDAHWTFNAETLKQDLLLCHGSSKLNFFGFHWGCSPYDLSLEYVLLEISAWIKKNPEEFLILYIEDHSDGRHEYLYALLEQSKLVDRIYPSGGCRAIPNDLTKHDVLAAGKQIVFWKDELRSGFEKIPCFSHRGIAQLAFNSLGNLKRTAEDRTTLGSFAKYLAEGKWPRIEVEDIRLHLINGSNITNLDNFIANDSRLYKFLWTWRIDTGLDEKKPCAILNADGFWDFEVCEIMLPVACLNQTDKTWRIASAVQFEFAQQACRKTFGEHYYFSSPINMMENKHLILAMRESSINSVSLNIHYSYKQNLIESGDKRKHNYTSETNIF